MAQIKADPVKFHTEDGGWSFLNNGDDSAGEGSDGSSEDEVRNLNLVFGGKWHYVGGILGSER